MKSSDRTSADDLEFNRSVKFLLTFAIQLTRVTLVPRLRTLRIIIFLLTSFFINSMFQIVATKQRCEFSMKNGRENRNNGNQEKGKEEKEALRSQ